MNLKRLCASYTLVASMVSLLPSAWSQQNPNPATGPAVNDLGSEEDETIVLSPFTVDAAEDADSYAAKASLAGTRIRTELKDVGSSISVVTAKFLEDTHSNRVDDLLVYAVNTEVAGQGGNYLGKGDGAYLTDTSTNLNQTTRVRGLSEAAITREFFLTDIPWDSYNTGRVDLQRGPNSILFGIGQPAGIINGSINQAALKSGYKFSASVGSYGTTRYAADLNHVILVDELAVRLSLLRDDTNYRQDPAFRDDHRVYGALKWEPQLLKRGSALTSLRVSYESGRIDANTPRNTPPLDAITPWFSDLDPSPTKGARATYRPSEVTLSTRQIPGYGPVGNNRTTAVDIQMLPDGSQGFALLPPNDNDVPANFVYFDLGPATFDKEAIDRGYYGTSINAWKARSLTDRTVFDFYNHLLEGPNKFEFLDFDALNVAVAQSFMDNRFGIELVYDKQDVKLGGFNYLDASAVSVTVDMMQQLTFEQNNPLVGRPLFLSAGGYGEWTDREREVTRATAFYDLDFSQRSGKDSLLGKVLGRNVFTGLWSKQENTTLSANYRGYFANDFISVNAADDFHTLNFYVNDIRLKNYLGAPITSSTASGLTLRGIKNRLVPQTTTILAYNYGEGIPDADRVRSIPMPVINNVDATDRDKMYNGGNKDIDTIESKAIVWQGYWLGGTIVPMVGFRTDDEESRAVGNAPSYKIGQRTLRDIWSPTWVLPDTPRKSSVDSKSYSIVTHLPQSWRDRLPGRADVSLLYNKSENFQPGAGRSDVLGNQVPDPRGETEEYGVAISALDDRLTFKVAKYETKVLNASLGGLPTFEIVASEIWGQWAAFNTRDLTHAGDPNRFQGSVIYGYADGDQAKPVTWQPDGPAQYASDGETFNYPNNLLVKAFNEQRAAVSDWFANQITDENFIRLWLDDPNPSAIDYVSFQNPSLNYAGQFPSQLGGPPGLVVTGNTESKGSEFEILAAPVRGLQVAFNASKTSAKRTGVAETYSNWLESRWEVFQGPAGEIRMWGNSVGPSNDDRADPVNGNDQAHGKDGETVRGRYGRLLMAPYWLFRALENSDVPELKPWAFNVVGNYDFQQGMFKDCSVGGSYRWQDRNVVGFPVITIDGVDQYDVDHPFKGSTQGICDVWLGYKHTFGEKYRWKIQLNVRNLLANDHLARVTVQPNGDPAAYRIPEPRTWSITNSIEF